jgi:drug/metabolite transporter (DMT)-like permease
MKRNILLTFLLLFGLVTLFMSSSVLFDWFGIREKEGNYVPGIVWANFVCGILYLVAAYGIIRHQIWARFPLTIALLILILASIVLFIHIYNGGLYETKTIGAMAFRTGVTVLFLLITTKIFKK